MSSGVMAACHMTRAATRAPRRALPRRRALCTTWKKPRESGSLSCEMPRCGRSQERSSDQNPSMVLTCTSQKPSPSSSRGILTPGMADRLVLIAPGGQASVDAILVGVDEGALSNGARDDRLDRPLLHVGQHVQDHLTTSLAQAEDRGLILLRRAPTRYAPQLAAPPRAPLLATAAGWPLCPATPRRPHRSPPRLPASRPGSGPPGRG